MILYHWIYGVNMAQHLTDQNVQDIVEILDYWSPNEKLTWDRLYKAIEV